MASKFRVTSREPLVPCSCRYCKGKKVSRYVRRQHNQRYQYEVRALKSLQGQGDAKSMKVEQEVLPCTCGDVSPGNDITEDVSLELSEAIHMDDRNYDKALGK